MLVVRCVLFVVCRFAFAVEWLLIVDGRCRFVVCCCSLMFVVFGLLFVGVVCCLCVVVVGCVLLSC